MKSIGLAIVALTFLTSFAPPASAAKAFWDYQLRWSS